MKPLFSNFLIRTTIMGGFVALAMMSSVAFAQTETCSTDPNSYGYSPTCADFLSASLLQPQSFSSESFPDTAGHEYDDSIRYLRSQGYIKGHPDGNFKPNDPINRAEFTKIIIEAKLGSTPSDPAGECFPDVERGIWFEKYVCSAKDRGILAGYPDGTFQPINLINFAEGSKITTNTFTVNIPSTNSDIWFAGFIAGLDDINAIPRTITSPMHQLTRGEMAEIMARIIQGDTSKPSLGRCDFVPSECGSGTEVGYGDEFLPGIDMARVRQTWLDWYNTERATLGRDPYTYNNQLNRSAYIWSEYMKNTGEVSHKRPGQTAYYDYNIIAGWFQDLGLVFKNIYRVTFSENIGRGPYSCNEADCTDELITAIRSTYDFYLAEKNQEDRAHYNSMTNQYFTEIGLGIVLDDNGYYLTVHYGTEIL